MSGHSKWSTIKHQKESNDLKRGQIFTKLANAITIAVRKGKGNSDPESNFYLRLAMDKAKAANVPKENIERAIKRGTRIGETNLEEAIYEGYGPGGIAIIVEAATDNKARTTSEIKNLFDKAGGKVSSPGSVSFLFKPVGIITINLNGKNSDEIALTAIDFGAIDIEKEDEKLIVYTEREDLLKIKSALENKGIEIENSEENKIPTSTVEIKSKEETDKILLLMDKLENYDDTQKVCSNFVIPNKLI